jgi:23S rRNA pseudouridine2605 synthase
MEEMILAGRITVNRMPAEVGQKVGPGDEVRINGELVKVRFAEPRARVLIYHKPAGELVTRDDPEGRPTVFEQLPAIGSGRWINVGRLDYNTEGLLLFTNSGELANRLMHPRYEVEREYAVRIMGRLTDEQLQALTTGVPLDDGLARCEKVADGGGDDEGANHWYNVVLKEGRNREVRRLFEALGLMVSRLIRTRFGTVAMPTHLKRGQIAELDAADVDAIVASAGLRAVQAQRPDTRSGPGKGKGPHVKASRPPKGRPHGPGGHRTNAGMPAHARGNGAALLEGAAATGAHPRPPNRPGPQGGGNPRAWKGRGGKGAAQRPHHDDAARRPAPAQPPHASRPRHNFDEVQPQSNANAAPFGRTTLTVPGGVPRGYGNDAGPRERSGPRARNAGGPGAHPRGNGGPHGGRRGFAPGGHRGPPAAHGHPAHPRPEVNGNVAPKGERTPGDPPTGSDDES